MSNTRDLKEIKGDVEAVAPRFVLWLFWWAYKRLKKITFHDEDGLPILEIRKTTIKEKRLDEKLWIVWLIIGVILILKGLLK
jgi:hypothetical protein